MKEKTEQFTFFWKGPFSQWWPSPFKDSETVSYNCAEQYMMYQKALLFNDPETATKILSTKSPREQKAWGRKVRSFDEGRWNRVARDIVYRGNIYKFMQNKGLLEKLLATSGTTLVECSPYDKIWGIGLAEDDPRCYNRATWKGKNWLGETLTKVRDDLEVVEWSIIMKDLANLNPVKAVYFGELKYDKRTYFARF